MISIRRIPKWLVVPFALALAVRVGLVLVQSQLHVFDVVYDASDSVLYRGLAASLVDEGRYWFDGRPAAYVTPGYPMFLAILYVFGRSTLFIGLVQAVLGAATVAVVADSARRLVAEKAAWIAGLYAALYPHFIFWTGYVLTETFYVFVLAVAVWCLVITTMTIERRGMWAVAAGLAWGITVLTRPNTLLFALGVALVGMMSGAWRKFAAIGLVAFCFVWGPWVVRNALTMKAFIPTSSEAGIVLYQGNSPGATGGTRGYVDSADFDSLQGLEELDEVARDRAYRKAAISWMTENPTKVIALAPRKLANMFRPTYAGSSVRNTVVTLLTYPLLLIGGTAGLIVLWRDGSLAARIIVLLVGYHIVIHALLTAMIRFRLPVEMLLCIAAGAAGAALIDRRVVARS